MQLLFGACQEDVGIPYLPVASAFAGLDTEHPPFEAEHLTKPGGTDDDGARLALFLGVTRALLAAATTRVVMLVIEDLHWADDATISLLRHLVAVGSEDAARRPGPIGRRAHDASAGTRHRRRQLHRAGSARPADA